jgi:teichuronic acid biosynthesis glycosyltransferase TuaG
MSELVSIITPVFNSENYIEECISSILNQSYQNWEMLIVDDKSTDKSTDLIKSFSKDDKRIILFFLNENVGSAMARNYAISRANGKYIAFLDSDDIWLPNKLQIQIDYMKKNECYFVFSSYDVISHDNTQTFYKIEVPKKISYDQYLKNTIIGCLTVVIDRDKFHDLEMPNLRSSHDMALWLNLLKTCGYAHGISETLALYRDHKSSNTSNKIMAAYDVWNVYRYHENLNFLYSMYNFMFYVLNAFKKRM